MNMATIYRGSYDLLRVKTWSFETHVFFGFVTGWGPQSIAKLPDFSGFMVDITIVNRAYNGL